MVNGTRLGLFLCGDVMTGRGVDQLLPCPSLPQLHEPFVSSALDYVRLAERVAGPMPRPVDEAYVWGVLPDVFEQLRPDVRIINLETSVTTSADAAPKEINYRMHPRNVAVLTAARVDCCVLANNHVLDWGRAGLLETLDTLARAGIPVAGAGRDLAAARVPAVLEVGESRRVLVVACGATDSGVDPSWAAGADTPGIHILPDLSERTVESIARLVSSARRGGDVVVTSLHWGHNWGYGVPGAHRRFARALIDRAHVDVVHGHSSHHPMAIEVHHGRPIFYGCGDLLNDYEGIRGHEGFRADLVLAYFPVLDGATGELVQLTMTPLQLRKFRLTRPADADRVWLRDTLDRECRRFGHRVTLHDDMLALEWR